MGGRRGGRSVEVGQVTPLGFVQRDPLLAFFVIVYSISVGALGVTRTDSLPKTGRAP